MKMRISVSSGFRWLCRLALALQVTIVLTACADLAQTGAHPLDATVGSASSDFTRSLSHDALDVQDLRPPGLPGVVSSTPRTGAGNPFAVLERVEAQLAKGNDARAAMLLSKLDTQLPEGTIGRVYQAHGILALRQGHLDRARTLLERSVDADGSLWRAWVRLGRIHLLAGRTADAQSAFVIAEQAAPKSASAQNDIGMGHLKLDKPGIAIEYFERAIRIDPTFQLAKANLTIAKAMSGDYGGAIKVTPTSQRQEALNNVGYAAFLRGDLRQADTFLQRAVNAAPRDNRIASANLDLIRN